MTQTVLILGASGRCGRHAKTAFSAAGWQTRSFNRKTDDLMQAAKGADVIFYGWNMPYGAWASEQPKLIRQVIAAAKSSGATVIIPGNVYVFGDGMPARIGPDTPHRATNPLGQLRIQLEGAFRQAGVKTILLRAGDFLDDQPSGNWFDMIIAKKAAKGVLSYPGRTDVPHAWAWLPDLTRTMVMLAEKRHELPVYTDLAFPGFTLTGEELNEECARALGRSMQLKRMNWLPIHLARPFWKEARHILEMRYLWDTPHALDGAALDGILPGRPQTRVASAIACALNHQVNPDKPMARASLAT